MNWTELVEDGSSQDDLRALQLLHKHNVQGRHHTGRLVAYRSSLCVTYIFETRHHRHVPENRVGLLWSSADEYEPNKCNLWTVGLEIIHYHQCQNYVT